MSSHELERVEVMGRVKNGDLKLIDAAAILELSYRQVKRLWQRYGEAGRQGLKHGNAGRPSNRRKPLKLRRKVTRRGDGAARRVLHLVRTRGRVRRAECVRS